MFDLLHSEDAINATFSVKSVALPEESLLKIFAVAKKGLTREGKSS